MRGRGVSKKCAVRLRRCPRTSANPFGNGLIAEDCDRPELILRATTLTGRVAGSTAAVDVPEKLRK
jgi:hypothetical protein